MSLHVYYAESEGDTDSYVGSAVDMDPFIESVIAPADAVRARGRHAKRINLSFDEWNVTHPRELGGDDLAEQTPWTFHRDWARASTAHGRCRGRDDAELSAAAR